MGAGNIPSVPMFGYGGEKLGESDGGKDGLRLDEKKSRAATLGVCGSRAMITAQNSPSVNWPLLCGWAKRD